MKLLLTNDDGIEAEGIHILAKELEKRHEVIISAPSSQRSASGHSITLTRPLVARETKIDGIKSRAFSIDGTPADCVRVGLDRLIGGEVDMVVSGINRGPNLGTDVIYSGTVSAAIEAAIYKIPSIAVSLDIQGDRKGYQTAAEYAAKILLNAAEHKIKNDMVLNINVPDISKEHIKGIKVCRVGGRIYNNYFIETVNEDKSISFDLKDEVLDIDTNDADTYYIKQGYVTVTPLHYDLTNFKMLKEVEEWF